LSKIYDTTENNKTKQNIQHEVYGHLITRQLIMREDVRYIITWTIYQVYW